MACQLDPLELPALPAVLKNLTNLFTLGGDYALYGRTYKANVWACVGLMLLSAICGGVTDLSFSAIGYFWQVCLNLLPLMEGNLVCETHLHMAPCCCTGHAVGAQSASAPSTCCRTHQIVNCLLTTAYMLAMRGAMDRVAEHTSDGQKLGEFSMVGGPDAGPGTGAEARLHWHAEGEMDGGLG